MQKFIFIMVLMLGLAGTVVFYQKHQKEQRRLAEIARQQEIERAKQAKAEAERIEREHQEAIQKHNEEIRRINAENRAKREAERQAEKARKEQEKKEAEAKAASARRETCGAILAKLDGAELRPWHTAPDADRPERVKTEGTFHCLLPDGEGGHMLLEQKVDFGRTVKATRIDSQKENEAFEPESFNRTVALFPNLLISGDRVYFRPVHAGEDNCRVPNPGEAFNPAEHDFGMAYDLVKETRVKTSAFVYDVFFNPFGNEQDAVLVATVPFDEKVTFETFLSKVGAWAKRNKAALEKARKKAQKKAPPQKVWKPSYVFTDKTVVKKRLDGVTEVPRAYLSKSNKHRYHPLSREYANEVKKEENAKAKWQVLYDKALADEEKAKALKAGAPEKQAAQGSTGNAVLDAGTVVYRLHVDAPAK